MKNKVYSCIVFIVGLMMYLSCVEEWIDSCTSKSSVNVVVLFASIWNGDIRSTVFEGIFRS